MDMPQHYQNYEFEALKCRFENQTEQLYRQTQIDLKIFTGFFTLQIAIGAWFATHESVFTGNYLASIAFILIDVSIAWVASMLLYRSNQRRK